MTDFLTRLAERTLGLAPRVQPLLASPYAPSSSQPVFHTREEEQLASAEHAQMPLPLLPQVPLVLPVAWNAPGAASPIAEEKPEATLALSATRPPERSTADRGEATIGRAASPAQGGVAGPPRDTRQSLQDQQPRTPIPANRDRQRELATGPLPPAVAAADNAEPANRPSGSHRAPSAAPIFLSPDPPEFTSELQHAEVAGAGRGVLVRPVVEGVSRGAQVVRPQLEAAAGQAPFPSEPEPGTPIIRVTIGRIEVRAVMPPPAAAERSAPVRASRGLSLDEYLKRFNEGKR